MLLSTQTLALRIKPSTTVTATGVVADAVEAVLELLLPPPQAVSVMSVATATLTAAKVKRDDNMMALLLNK